jgi:DtxR family Mn-dependent transcriptional regulator
VDRYLETIYCLATEGETVRPGRIAHWLGVSAPTVSIGLHRLHRDGWVDVAPDRSVTLTPTGNHAATGIVRRHRLVERWLTDTLGMDWARAHTEACRLAPAFSEGVLTLLDASLGQPATCPHGHAIPGRAVPYGPLVPLADVEPGTRAVVRRISEILEHESLQILRDLSEHGVRAGVTVAVGQSVDASQVSVVAGEDLGHPLRLTLATAHLIWVETPRAASAAHRLGPATSMTDDSAGPRSGFESRLVE